MSTVEYSRIRQYGITPALCIIACLCFGFFALVVWDTILTIALERSNNFSGGGGNNGTNVPSPTPTTGITVAGSPTPTPTLVVLGNNEFEVPVAVVAGVGGKNNVRADLLANKKAQLLATGNDADDDYKYKDWKADVAVAPINGDNDDDSDGGAQFNADVPVAPRPVNDDDADSEVAGGDDDDVTRFQADVPVATSNDDDDNDDDDDDEGANAGGGSTTATTTASNTVTILPSSAPTSGGAISKRDRDNAEIQLARGAIKTGNKYIDEKKAKETPKQQASKPQQQQQQQQQAQRILSMAERRQALIDAQKQAREADLQRVKRV